MNKKDLRDQVIWHVWARNGGGVFKPLYAFDSLPSSVQDVLLSGAYSHKEPFRSATIAIGHMLAEAADSCYRSANGLGVVRVRKGVYSVIRRGAVERLEVANRSEALALARKVAKALEVLDGARLELAALIDAIGRDSAEGDADAAAEEVLAAIARAHGDAWRPLRTLGPVVGRSSAEKARFVALVGRVVGGMELEQQIDERTGWRLYRVVLAD